MLTKFDMESVRTATTPYEAAKTKLKDETDPPVNVHLYRSMIGSLMYLTALRPDIMFAVSACSRHQVTPMTFSLNASQEIFKNLKGATKIMAVYPKESPFSLESRPVIEIKLVLMVIGNPLTGINTAASMSFLPVPGMVSEKRLILAGSTLFLMVVILPAGCLISAGSTMSVEQRLHSPATLRWRLRRIEVETTVDRGGEVAGEGWNMAAVKG
ncbi:hypothetical protein Tco_1450031 [Tanacetum coccineum]